MEVIMSSSDDKNKILRGTHTLIGDIEGEREEPPKMKKLLLIT